MADSHPSPSKLHLKRTPAEQAERARRKALKAARKAAKRLRRATADGSFTSDSSGSKEKPRSKRRKHRRGSNVDGLASQPSPPREIDSDAIRDEIEKEAFMEKMCGAFEDDERLDTIHSKFDSYVHIPGRWADNRTGQDSHLARDPQYMDDDEYAEWVREGMWRRKHAREYEERARKESERTARRAREAQARAETVRLEKATSERREQKRREKEELRQHEYQSYYETRWQELLNPGDTGMNPLAFMDIPWPLSPGSSLVVDGHTTYRTHRIEDFTEEAISKFLTVKTTHPGANTDKCEDKVGKEKLRETILRFHPDKFEGRVMQRVLATDRDRVREAIGQIARVLNALMGARS
ncbi:hypothetical protein F5J12DRAFT_720439 [Pisolithus orientalis]|uniref:uncharacterized protein n=1 Tax=Pisolithus orientalis TaxID=936130 RepID=UPI002223FB1B|nr:uncharacterized protein F5J12DRAFT_720439 [Pisolithus orientalis]KAI6007706.1 hypothetical protein F5J12DRAFT_720439 [Pisolithus orientalis]